jgi:DNA polymerase-3 subunit epsilon
MEPIRLDKPIAVFDLETTGVDTIKDRIVELSVVKLDRELNIIEKRRTLVNPLMPIPNEAAVIHGVTDQMVKDAPTFKEIAKSLHSFIADCNLGGYNIIRFDVPLLSEEFGRVGLEFPLEGMSMIDSFNIFKLNNKRDLTSAYKYYTGKTLENAHSALYDTLATAEILKEQLSVHDLPLNGESLQDYCLEGKKMVDIHGKILLDDDGDLIFSFGKHKGKKLKDNQTYANWMLDSDFPEATKKVIRDCFKKLDNVYVPHTKRNY